MTMSILMLGTLTINAQETKKLNDVVVEKLETVCDCADAKAIGLKEELAAKKKGGFTDVEAKAWELKSTEISSHCMGKKGYTYGQFRECNSMKEVMKEMEAYMREKKTKKIELTFDDKVSETCYCFKSAKEDGGDLGACFQKQSNYAKSVGDRSKEFIQTTNKCQ